MPPVDPCQTQACNIQKCLQAKNYKEELCTAEIELMLQCCEKWREKSKCCDGFLKDKNEISPNKNLDKLDK